MARVTLYLPEPLFQRYRDELGSDVNLSAIFQQAVRDRLQARERASVPEPPAPQ